MARDEWEFWTSDEELAALPQELTAPARAHLPPLANHGRLDTIDGERDVLPGVRVIPAPGHTPGHVAIVVTSGGDGLLFMGDAVVHELHLNHPEWLSPIDLIPNLSVATRRRLGERAARENLTVVAFHVSRHGRLEEFGGGYAFRTDG